MQLESHKQVSIAFILSTVSGVLILLQGSLRVIRTQWGLELGIGEFRRHILGGIDYKILGIVSIVLGVMVILGAILLDKPDRARQGGITVLAFSVLSIFSGGGFIAGLILGVIGGAIALSEYQAKPSQTNNNSAQSKSRAAYSLFLYGIRQMKVSRLLPLFRNWCISLGGTKTTSPTLNSDVSFPSRS